MEQRTAASFRVFLVEDSALLRTRMEAMLAGIGAVIVGHAAGARAAPICGGL